MKGNKAQKIIKKKYEIRGRKEKHEKRGIKTKKKGSSGMRQRPW